MSEAGHRAELFEVIRQVRNRWRLKLAARGAAVVVGGSVLALLLSASGLEALRFTSHAVIGFRIAILVIVCTLLARWIVAPLRRRVKDGQVALYLEERDPSLQAQILSAVDAVVAESPDHSPALVDRLVALAVERCRALDAARLGERAALRRHLLTISGVLAAAILLVVFGPTFLRHGVSALLVLSRSAEAASPYKIDVRPGNATVPRGSDQAVTARLVGFKASDATLMFRAASIAPGVLTPGSNSAFERVPLVASADPVVFEGMMFHLDKPIEYYVESSGVRSPTFSMALVDLPAVRQLDLEYHFPAYTGLPPQKVEGGGDIAALRGTEVLVRVVSTMPTPAGRIVLNESSSSPLIRQGDGSLTGRFTIERQGFYQIELEGPHGERVSASPQYTIDVLGDQPPTVSITKPSRDTSATSVEEVFVEARADDDFGVKQLRLVYSVNGGPEKTVKLFDGSRTEVSAGHTLYLEELGLNPGDVVSYYARATDNDTVQGPKTATSDIYFVQIRPFKRDFKPAQSQAQGGGGNTSDVGALSKAQKEVVAGTFNAVRDRAKVSAEKYRENVVFLTLAQARVRQQVDDLTQKMSSRQVDRDPAFKKIAELLPKASAAMREAEIDLQKQIAKEALSPEQRALQLLQEAEQEYELQVSASREGGGGGGGSDSLADDLADLFALELDKLANQYEMQQRADQQTTDRKIDEIAEKLKELARRQLAEAERQRRLAAAGQSQGGSGGSQQRALADEAEQAARRLEQLTRDQPRQDVRDAARRLQEAADAMRRAAANASRDGGAQAAAAEERLKEALDRLARNQAGRGDRDVQNAKRLAEELVTEQKAITAEVQGLEQVGAGRDARVQKLVERKDAMEAKVDGLEHQLQQLVGETRANEREASRKLQEAAGSIRDNKVREKIRYSKGMLQGQATEYAKGFEQNIGENLESLRNKIGEAASSMGQASKQSQLARALEQTRDLVRGAESLNQRMRQRSQGNGEQGREGQAGRDGRAGQAGREGQAGQAGQGGQGGTNARIASGPPQGGATSGDARPSGMSAEEARQFARELREWTNSAAELRRRLAQANVNSRDLDAIIREIRDMDLTPAGGEPRGLQQLQAAVDRLKKFEFDLRKKVDSDNQHLFLSGSDEVPAGFRQAIEEYYRALAKKGSR